MVSGPGAFLISSNIEQNSRYTSRAINFPSLKIRIFEKDLIMKPTRRRLGAQYHCKSPMGPQFAVKY